MSVVSSGVLCITKKRWCRIRHQYYWVKTGKEASKWGICTYEEEICWNFHLVNCKDWRGGRVPSSILCTRGHVLVSLQAGHLHDHCLPGTALLFFEIIWGCGPEGGREVRGGIQHVCLSRLFESQIWLRKFLNEKDAWRLCWIYNECNIGMGRK